MNKLTAIFRWRLSPGTVRVLLLVLFAFLVAAAVVGLTVVKRLSEDLPSPARILNIDPPSKTVILAANGDTIHEYYVENRTAIPLAEIPIALRQAVIATEDRRFYDHYGLDARRLAKVVYENLTSTTRPGASTITQQLARNLFLSFDKKISRKLKEMILALQLEQTYSKDEILEMYLNVINFGSGAYGVQAASRTFFGKNVSELELGECAMLAGIIQRPEAYSPIRELDRAYRRRTTVLYSMVAAGFLERDEAAVVDSSRVLIVDGRRQTIAPTFAPYFVEVVRKELEDRYGYEGLYHRGLRVTTTLLPNAQRAMEEAVESHLSALEAEFGYPMTKARYDSLVALDERPERIEYLLAASVLLDVRTGAVRGLVGGRDFHDSKWDLTLQAARQPGSIFKPVVYLTALQQGYNASSILMDTPVVIRSGGNDWRPKNFNNRFMGPMTMRYGLSHSKNVVTAKLIDDFGVGAVISTARRLGISSRLPAVPSLALGAGEVNLMEMVSAYSAFGNHGVRVEPYFITRVETAEGEILEETRIHQTEVLDAATAYLMSNLMQSTLQHGTAVAARRLGFTKTGAGKTGTYNKYTDAWFVGFTPSLAAGVWVGFDEKVSMGRSATGSHMALPIWANFMGKITEGKPDEVFVRPAGIIEKVICLRSGQLATAYCDSTASEVFLSDQFPQRPCDLHGGPLQDVGGFQRGFDTLDEDDEF